MMCPIKYSPAAIRDLDRVWDEVYSASRDLDVTSAYMDELMDKIESKSEFPKSGSPLYYENIFTGYYFVVYKAYLAFYRVERNIIWVDRILYKKSDYMRQLHLDKDTSPSEI